MNKAAVALWNTFSRVLKRSWRRLAGWRCMARDLTLLLVLWLLAAGLVLALAGVVLIRADRLCL